MGKKIEKIENNQIRAIKIIVIKIINKNRL